MKKPILIKKEILYWLFLFFIILRLYPRFLPMLSGYFGEMFSSMTAKDKKPQSLNLLKIKTVENKTVELSQDIGELKKKNSAEIIEKFLIKYGLRTYSKYAHNSVIKELIYNLLLNFLLYKRGLICERSDKLPQASMYFLIIITNDKLDELPSVREFKGEELTNILKDWSSLHQLKNAAFIKSIYLEEDKEEFSAILTKYEQHEGVMHRFATIHAFPLVAGGGSEEIEECSSQETYARSIFSQWKECWRKARSVFGGTISKEKVFACFMAGREFSGSVGSHDDDRGVDKDKGQTKKSQAGDDHARNQGKLWTRWADKNYETIGRDRLAKYAKMYNIIRKLEAPEPVSKKQAKDKNRIHSPREQEKFNKLRTEREEYWEKWRERFNKGEQDDEKEPKMSRRETNEKNRPVLWGDMTNKEDEDDEDNDNFRLNFRWGKGD